MAMNAKQAAEKWNISDRRVRTLCANGQIDGAYRIGKIWYIPDGTDKPKDGRIKAKESLTALIEKKKAELEGYNIDDDIFDYIATNVKSNIRELEGSLTKLVAYSNFTHSEINIKFAEDVLKDIISPNAHREVTPELIIQVVAEHYGITSEDIASQKRNSEVAFPRQIAMYLCRTMTDVPLATIGSYMGKRDHSTIKHGADKISKDITKNDSLKNTIEVIMKKINPS